mmetsp:Transcript_73995/g.111457  ORF Transcript_73995/g.111457 Transcript_73995/m.111457 type:complete len:138 (-) Transcript_73995:88-501(-)
MVIITKRNGAVTLPLLQGKEEVKGTDMMTTEVIGDQVRATMIITAAEAHVGVMMIIMIVIIIVLLVMTEIIILLAITINTEVVDTETAIMNVREMMIIIRVPAVPVLTRGDEVIAVNLLNVRHLQRGANHPGNEIKI